MEYKICSRCIIDTTVPGVTFDIKGECNFCRLHDKLDKRYSLDEEGRDRLEKLIESIKKAGRNKRYDCIVGISGGRDSTYTLYLVKKMGLRPLAVHFNDGFGNPVQRNTYEHRELVDGVPWSSSMLRGKEPVLVAVCPFCRRPGLFRKAKHGVCLLQNASRCARCGRTCCPGHTRQGRGGSKLCPSCAPWSGIVSFLRSLFLDEK